jgi:hypothetical protein
MSRGFASAFLAGFMWATALDALSLHLYGATGTCVALMLALMLVSKYQAKKHS